MTTVRFGVDLWRLLEVEAALAGVSVSQYIREAALARAPGAAATRGQDPLALLAGAEPGPLKPCPQPASERAATLLQQAAETGRDNQATSSEADQAVRRSREVRKEAAQLRRQQRATGR